MRFIIYLLFCSSCCYGYGLQNLLLQYFAHKAYKSGDFASSKSKYTQLLAKSPYDAELNYNLGTIFYKEKQYEDALSYLNRAVLHAKPNSTLHEQSLFNRANNLVAQKQFADAIKDYQKVLQINPDNQKASHNLKMVEQMLKDQDQQKNTKQNQQKSEDKNKEQSSSDKQKENNEQSKNDSSNSSVSQEQNQNSSDDKNEQENLSSDQQRNQSNENNDEQSKKQKRNQQENESKQQDNKQQQEKNANRQNNQQTEEDQASKLEKTKEKEVKHQQPLGEQSDKKDSLNSASSQEKNQELQKVQLDDACTKQILEQLRDDERLAERSVTLLEKLDEHEKNIQKKLLQMNVTKAGAQKYGQKNW